MNRVSFGEYSILCIRRIWVDWPGMGLPISPSSCFGPNEPGLCLGCCGGAWVWHGAHCSFGLVSGILGPFLYPHQFPYIQKGESVDDLDLLCPRKIDWVLRIPNLFR